MSERGRGGGGYLGGDSILPVALSLSFPTCTARGEVGMYISLRLYSHTKNTLRDQRLEAIYI